MCPSIPKQGSKSVMVAVLDKSLVPKFEKTNDWGFFHLLIQLHLVSHLTIVSYQYQTWSSSRAVCGSLYSGNTSWALWEVEFDKMHIKVPCIVAKPPWLIPSSIPHAKQMRIKNYAGYKESVTYLALHFFVVFLLNIPYYGWWNSNVVLDDFKIVVQPFKA